MNEVDEEKDSGIEAVPTLEEAKEQVPLGGRPQEFGCPAKVSDSPVTAVSPEDLTESQHFSSHSIEFGLGLSTSFLACWSAQVNMGQEYRTFTENWS